MIARSAQSAVHQSGFQFVSFLRISTVKFGAVRGKIWSPFRLVSFLVIHHIQVITTRLYSTGFPLDKILSCVCVCVCVCVCWGGGPLPADLIVKQRKQTGVEKLRRWVVPEKMYSCGAFRCMSSSWFPANRKKQQGDIFSGAHCVQWGCPQMTTPSTYRQREGPCSTYTHLLTSDLQGSCLRNLEICSWAFWFYTRRFLKLKRGHDRESFTVKHL